MNGWLVPQIRTIVKDRNGWLVPLCQIQGFIFKITFYFCKKDGQSLWYGQLTLFGPG